MDDGFDLSFEFSAQRDHITTIALCDDRFLQLGGRIGQIFLKARHQTVMRHFEGAS